MGALDWVVLRTALHWLVCWSKTGTARVLFGLSWGTLVLEYCSIHGTLLDGETLLGALHYWSSVVSPLVGHCTLDIAWWDIAWYLVLEHY